MFLLHCYDEFPHSYIAIEISVYIGYVISQLDKINMSPSLMGVATERPHPSLRILPRARLSSVLEITPADRENIELNVQLLKY